MAEDEGQEALRGELRTVEAELAELRQTATALRQSIGGQNDGPTETEDVSAVLAEAAEQDQLIDALTTRRDSLRKRLGQE